MKDPRGGHVQASLAILAFDWPKTPATHIVNSCLNLDLQSEREEGETSSQCFVCTSKEIRPLRPLLFSSRVHCFERRLNVHACLSARAVLGDGGKSAPFKQRIKWEEYHLEADKEINVLKREQLLHSSQLSWTGKSHFNILWMVNRSES